MEENNKFETNADGFGSGSVLYGEKPQPKAEENGQSSVYGSESQGMAPIYNSQPMSGGQMNQNPMGYGPMQVPPPVQGAPASKPKKNTAGIIVGILCAAAVFLVIAAGVLLSKSLLGGNAKQQLAKGIANMTKEMAAYQSSAVGDIGLAQLNRLKDTRPIHTNVDLSFTDPSASGSFSSIDVEIDAVTDYSEKMAKMDLSVGAYGFSMKVGNIVAADNTLYVSVPLLSEEMYSLDLTNLGRDFNNSAWPSLIGETMPEDYSLTLFQDMEKSGSGEQSGGEDGLQKIFLGQGGFSEDSIQYEAIRQKKRLTFGGNTAEYGGVRVIMDRDAYNQSMETMREEFLASDYYADIMKRYEAAYAGDFGEFEEYMEEFFETMFSLRLEQDLVLDFYLDKKGRIVNISTSEDIAVSSQYTELDSLAVDIYFAGAERTLDSVEGGIYAQVGDEILYMGISRTADLSEEHYNEELTLSIQSDNSDDELTFRYKNDWGCNDRTFDLEMALEVPDSSMEISADGSFMDIVKGEGYTFRIAHSAITIDGEDLLLMAGSILTEPSDDTIEVPDNAMNIFEMSESDIMRLLYGYSSLY